MANIPLKTIQFPDLPDTYVAAPPITDSASGAIASFSDGADDLPVKDLTVSIVPKQAGSGTPSPSNVRAISGFTEATIKRAGKNLIPYPYYHTTETVNGVTFTVGSDGTVTANGTATALASFSVVDRLQSGFTVPAGQYILSGCPSGGGSSTYQIRIGRTVNNADSQYGQDNGTGLTFTRSDDGDIGIQIWVRQGQTVSNLVFRPMLRPASITDATFEPYTADTYEVSFGSAGTVYGGTLDVNSGTLTVDRNAVLINSLTWTAGTASGRTYFKATLADKVMMGAAQDYPLVTSNIVYGGNYTVTNMPNPSICQAPNSREFRIYDSAVSSVSDMLSKYGTGQVCYYLATPVEYNLTPAEITTLLGTNTLWADTGDISVEYVADTKMYIDNKIAELQALVLD